MRPAFIITRRRYDAQDRRLSKAYAGAAPKTGVRYSKRRCQGWDRRYAVCFGPFTAAYRVAPRRSSFVPSIDALACPSRARRPTDRFVLYARTVSTLRISEIQAHEKGRPEDHGHAR